MFVTSWERYGRVVGAVTLGFVGYASSGDTERASAYEDAVLGLLDDHGARVLFRGKRAADQDPSLPAEVQLLWFPSRQSLDDFLADDRRLALLVEHGEVFTAKQAVELDSVTPVGPF